MYAKDILQDWRLQWLVPMNFGGWFLFYIDINIFFYVWPQLEFGVWYRDKYSLTRCVGILIPTCLNCDFLCKESIPIL